MNKAEGKPKQKQKQKLKVTKDGKVYIRGVKTYVNGDKYDGEFVDALRHGQGRMRFANGDLYDGEFERNYFQGFGTYSWAAFLDSDNSMVTGRKYVGEWADGKKHGKGIFTLGNGDVYSGFFKNDLYDGMGTLKKRDGDVIEGEWCRGRPSGKVKIKFANGDNYEGDMVGGHYEGGGKMTYASDMGVYDGQWHNGQYHGRGTRLYSNNTKFVGDFVEGEIEGEGMMFYPNGDQYLGSWKRGLFDGKGVYRYANGESYEGTFKLGMRYGEGKYRYKDSGYYHGEYRNIQSASVASSFQLPLCDGKRHGIGIRVWSTGARYEGQWVEDKMHGSGILNTAEGGKYEGGFFCGLRSGSGVEHFGNVVGEPFTCPLGNKHGGIGFCVFKGEYKQGLFHGFGEMTCMSGQWYKGHWRRGKRHGEGEIYFLRNGEIGNSARMFIGGVDSLYRIESYKGQFNEDDRTGNGVARYVNGDTLEGHFERGLPHGTIVCTFAHTRKIALASYVRGERVGWVERHQKQIKPGALRSRSSISKSVMILDHNDKPASAARSGGHRPTT